MREVAHCTTEADSESVVRMTPLEMAGERTQNGEPGVTEEAREPCLRWVGYVNGYLP